MRELARPIPAHGITDTAEYRTVAVVSSDTRSREPLVELRALGVASDAYYARTDGHNVPYRRPLPGADPIVRVRRGVAERLVAVNRRLAVSDVEVVVLDGHRTLACQKALWTHFTTKMRRALPSLNEAALEKRVRRYVADPRQFSANDPATWPTHITGGAVDLTLRRRGGGEWLYMGGVFDDPSPVSHTAFYESVRHASNLSALTARDNRRLLYWSMLAEGFVNLATEWWHFDWGTQLWALGVRRAKKAARAQAFYRPIV